jgi:hypothetical protein
MFGERFTLTGGGVSSSRPIYLYLAAEKAVPIRFVRGERRLLAAFYPRCACVV